VAKLREDRSRPSEEDRCQRSKGLTNSRVHKVKVKVLGITSLKDASGERRTDVGSRTQEDHWIRTWGRFSGPRKKRFEILAMGIARLREVIYRQLESRVGHSGV
jgi:hypothetical protein